MRQIIAFALIVFCFTGFAGAMDERGKVFSIFNFVEDAATSHAANLSVLKQVLDFEVSKTSPDFQPIDYKSFLQFNESVLPKEEMWRTVRLLKYEVLSENEILVKIEIKRPRYVEVEAQGVEPGYDRVTTVTEYEIQQKLVKLDQLRLFVAAPHFDTLESWAAYLN
jgi:hypothetical protein